MSETIKSLDLLVHPFYSVSRIANRFLINQESEQNILQLKNLWLDSIDDVANDAERALVIVNSVEILAEPQTELHNPYRTLYGKIVDEAKRKLDGRLFYFSPAVPESPFSLLQANGLSEASVAGKSFKYDSQKLRLIAYGEHVDEETKGGCVDFSVRQLAKSLSIQQANIAIDPDRSLPSLRTIRKDGGYYLPNAIYLTITQIKKLSDAE